MDIRETVDYFNRKPVQWIGEGQISGLNTIIIGCTANRAILVQAALQLNGLHPRLWSGYTSLRLGWTNKDA